eukprot:12987795-Alexandrium_andersonii.AAC.1
MSASLVGSEMCIRDRVGTCARTPFSATQALCWEALETPRLGAKSPTPVSYTHLTLPTICSV